MVTWIGSLARRAGVAASALGVAARSLASLDTNPVPADWEHVTKVDPEDEKKLSVVYPLYLRHTDAVSVGGSADVTAHNTVETFELLSMVPDVPTFHEPSAPRHVTDRTREESAFLAIPEVLNGHSQSLVGDLGTGIDYLREEVVPTELAERLPGWVMDRWGERLSDFGTTWLLANAVFEAYIIQNPDSAAAREGDVSESDVLSPTEAKRRALAAEKHLSSEVVYVEYSGTFGGREGLETVSAIADAVSWSRLWYGGGLDSRKNATAVLDAGADAVIVGNVFHEIAVEEQALYEAALEDLGTSVEFGTLRSWVDERVRPGESSAVDYLSTIPSISTPRERACGYLARAIYLLMILDRLAERAASLGDSPSESDLRRFLDDTGPDYPELAVPAGSVQSPERRVVREVLLARLGERLGVETTSKLPVSHIGIGSERDAVEREA